MLKKQKQVKLTDHIKINTDQNPFNRLLAISQSNIYQRKNTQQNNKNLKCNCNHQIKIFLKKELELVGKHQRYYQKSKNQFKKSQLQELIIKDKFQQLNLENFMIEEIFQLVYSIVVDES